MICLLSCFVHLDLHSFPTRLSSFFEYSASTELYTLSLHDALPISGSQHIFISRLIKRSAANHEHVARLRSEEHTSELQSHVNLVCRLLLEKKNSAGMPRPIASAVFCLNKKKNTQTVRHYDHKIIRI